ncbi:symmetrical bis(5'-nucleosyl)-tetraphosphatase [Roseateles chitosanitabidus]|jgi:bis(5'-nucleosyl)-tetraphosphatase (symmetrical)|uniref:symmetrical bis(5'-nucleosyl)-tetraphosphatase n=1 Tax=Roseateles chitosanitabidus TaxID=65048 RepID=UPI0008342F36|nr:symmetrical bis(5'-nucleosyl)-tetraphosphatase [Roseateles chitosanitabidus]MBO9688814.1 symmetrical bis(5'-nucleosyl)-tetraphosphatase [Roseateles chitosanitabidus]
MHYLIGDLQGCCDALARLLEKIDFSPSRDRLYLLGDLVNRGPDSLTTLRRLQSLGDAAQCLLGNHDLHLLAMAAGVRAPHKGDTLTPILNAPDREALLDWLRHQRLAIRSQGWLMVHAGVVPQWDADQTLALADEVHALLSGPDLADFLPQMYGNEPDRWRDDLAGVERLRFIINVLTRIRFCNGKGKLDFKTKEGLGTAPEGYLPWFEVPGRRTAGQPIAFGHWSTLGLVQRPDLLALDTGCVWGGELTAARVADGQVQEIIQVQCAQARKPGAD